MKTTKHQEIQQNKTTLIRDKTQNTQLTQPSKSQSKDQKSLLVNLNFDNVLPIDKQIIKTYLSPQSPSFWENLFQRGYYPQIKQMLDQISKYSNRIKNITINSPKSINPIFTYKKIYISPLEYYFFKKPNTISSRINFCPLNNRFKKPNCFIQENEMSCGVEYSQQKQKKALFVQNSLFFRSPFEFIFKYKTGKCENDIKRKSQYFTNKINILYNLNKDNYSFIFRDYLPFNSINRLNLQLIHKTINNQIDANANATLPNINDLNLPLQDSKFSIKTSYERNKLKYQTLLNSHLKLNSSINKTLNCLYIKSKFFIRKILNVKDIFFSQFNIEGGNVFEIKKLGKQEFNPIKVNDKLFIYNFNGIINPSDKIVPDTHQSNQNNNKYVEFMLGNMSYILFKSKIMFKKNPLNLLENFSLDKDGFEIMPLTFFNMLFTNISRKTIFKNARTSAGIGVSVISKLFSFEILYTPYVHLHKGDIHAKFHLKFGID